MWGWAPPLPGFPPWLPARHWAADPLGPFHHPRGLPLCCQDLLPPAPPSTGTYAYHRHLLSPGLPESLGLPQPGVAASPTLALLLTSGVTQDGFIAACLLLCWVGYGPYHTGDLNELPPARLLLTSRTPRKPVRQALPALLSRRGSVSPQLSGAGSRTPAREASTPQLSVEQGGSRGLPWSQRPRGGHSGGS